MLAAALVLVVGVPTATGVHDDDLFQLDYVTAPVPQGAANVSSTNVTPIGNDGDDWDKVFAGTSSAFATAFIPDPVGSAETSFYTGGGSKDERPISTGNQHWEWDDSDDVVPDKDDLSHAFAAAYRDPDDGHIIFYFGADRFDTSGDAEVGFWFFRQPVTLGTKPNFNGEHEVGDILVLANWGGSNKVGDIAVYRWIGGNKPLELVKDTTEADCSVAPANDAVCAVVNNTGGETPPWSYTNKDDETSYQETALFEGGIDLNALLGVQDIGCFSSFLAATRSSHSTDAQLKDFALGAFPVCGIDVTKTGDELSKIGDPASYTITIENTGQATLYKRNISDTLLGAITTNGVNQPNPYVTGNTCGASLAAGATCTITATRTVQPGDPDPLPNTVTILYTEKANFTGLSFTQTDDHEVNLFQPAVSITKEGDGLSKIGDPVTYTFTIKNESSADSPNLTLASVTDNIIGNLKTQADAAGCDVLTVNETCSFNVTRTVTAADLDPLVNTVDVLYHPVGFPNNITASDGHSVNLFQPSVRITKNGDELSKIGDGVTYTFDITNTSSADSPNLVLDSITDDVLGDLSDEAPAACDSIAPGASCSFNVPWTVAAVDVQPADGQADDPVINTVTIHFHPDGFPNDITATASHELNLFQPSIAFSKTADTTLSKIGDDVNYTLTLNNTSSPDSPSLVCTITDAKLGVNKQVTLASGTGDVTNIAYTVKAGDADPFVNTASVSCSPQGFPNVLTDSDSWTVNLFQPSVEVVKDGDTLSKIGDTVTYTFTIRNTSSADSPNLDLVGVNDDVLGNLAAPAACDNLAPGASCTFTVDFTIPVGSPDPLVNTVEVHYRPTGFPNDIKDTDTHSVNLFQPSITFDKSADTELSKATDVVNYTLTLSNTSSADSPDLVCTISDAKLGVNKPVTLASGQNDVTNVAYTVKATDPDPLVNNASVSCSPRGFPNILTANDSWTVNLFQPSIVVTKTGDPLSKVGDDVKYTIEVCNTSSADSPNLVKDSVADSLIAGVNAAFGASLAPGACESHDFTRTVQAGDADPLVNTATAHYHPAGFTNDITDSDDHTTNLFQPSLTITKTGDALSKVGDAVNYTIEVCNTSSADSPALVKDSVSDTLIAGVNAAFGASLASGACESHDFSRTVQAGDADPLVNTATAHYHPAGFPNDITDTDSHTTNLFQPSLTIEKTGDALSKVGDAVNYTIEVCNTSSADSPALVKDSVTDNKIAGVNAAFGASLASGACESHDFSRTVQAGDADPLVNTATAHYHPAGFPNDISDTDSHTTNLFQPSIVLTKTADNPFSKAGDSITYTITIANTSSSDSPALVLDSFSDSVVSGVTPPAACSPLAAGANCSFSYTYLVQAGDADPLVNTATAHYHPVGFPNDIADSDAVTVDLLHPAFTVTKACTNSPVDQGGTASFTITYRNTGDADLVFTPAQADEGGPQSVAAGGTQTVTITRPVPDGATSVSNAVSGTVTLAGKYGLANSYPFAASGSCEVKGKAKVVKTVSGQPPAADQSFTFELRQGASVLSDGTILETASTDASGNISFTTQLTPGATYQICEWVFPGWNTNLAGDGPLFVPNSIIPPALPNPNVNNLTVCVNFTVTSGQTRTFTVDNSPPPGGRALTIGFWKNWASCASSSGKGQDPMLDLALGIASATTTNPPGGLVVSAQNPGSLWPNYAATWYLVLKGDPTSTEDSIKPAPGCLKAVRLLNKSTVDTGKKMASDPLFNMTAQLVAAQLNRFLGAGISGITITNIDKAVLLNGKYKFNGITYTPKPMSAADIAKANCLATQLDNYNNNRPVSNCP